MEPIDIKHAIEKAGSSQVEVAREAGVTPAQVYRVIYKNAISRNVRSVIARTIGKRLEELWPEYAQPEEHQRKSA